MNLPQSEQCWVIMRWGMPLDYKHPRAAYFNVCLDKEEKPVTVRTQSKQPAQPRSRSFVKAERKEILKLIKEGKDNKEIYDSIVAQGHFINSEGETMTKRTFLPVISKIRKKANIPLKPNIKSRVFELIKQKKTVDEIKSIMDLNSEQITNVFCRLRIKLSAYRRGELIYLKGK